MPWPNSTKYAPGVDPGAYAITVKNLSPTQEHNFHLIGPGVDIFSFGVLACQLLTGHLPAPRVHALDARPPGTAFVRSPIPFTLGSPRAVRVLSISASAAAKFPFRM